MTEALEVQEQGQLSIFDATMIAEGVQEADLSGQLEAWGRLVETGICWKLQGYFGRNAANLIENGFLTREGVITDFALDYIADREEPV